MSDATDPKAWVARAEEDYLLARSALRRKTPLAYGACFHAQQCAEIYFKAILVQRGASFPKTCRPSMICVYEVIYSSA